MPRSRNDGEQGVPDRSTCGGRSRCRRTSTSTTSARGSGSSRTPIGGPETLGRPAQAVGLPRGHRHRPHRASRPGAIPSPAWLKSYCEQITCIEDAAGWRTGKNVNMAIGQGEVLVTPLQLASAYATLGNGGTRWVPQVVREIRDASTDKVKRPIEPKQAGTVDMHAGLAAGDHRGPGRRDHPGGRHRGRRVQRLPQRRLPGRRQDRHRPGERQGPDGRVRRLRPGAATRTTPSPCSWRSPATAARPPRPWPAGCSTCSPARCRCPPAPDRRPGARARRPVARRRGRARLMTAALPAPRPASPRARSAGCPATRPRPGATSTSSWSAASRRSEPSGCLMIFSSTRGREPGRLRHQLPRRSRCCSWASASAPWS